MPDHLFIAEKPSLAEVIAKARAEQLGVRASKGSGSWTVGPDAVTWLFGHMYELANPDEYDAGLKRWEMGTLPIIPDKWKRKAHKDKRPHLSMIKDLMSKTKVVVNVGDAEREGQLLVDELLEEMGWNPFSDKTKRVWVSSFAQKDLLAALEGMFPNKDKENLSKAATMRQRADWLHGINMTRLYTILARSSGANMLVSVGRVQSPTLKLVVDRDREIAAFKPTDHYLPNGLFRHDNGTFRADWVIPEDHEGLDPDGRLVDKKVAERIAAKIVGKTGKIQSFTSTNKSKQPPLPYSLSALQTDCSRKIGLTAAQTLEVAQALYEKHKATTYPRSDSRYLPKSILTDEAPGIMTALASTPGLDTLAQKADLRLKSAAWNDAKVSDHHGIIPTSEFDASKLAGMSPVERKVFDLIAKAFISQFYPDFTWKSLVATLSVEGETFKATGRQVMSQGWKVVYGAEEEDEDEDEEAKQVLPTMAKGDAVVAEKSDISSKRTKPPAHFTDGTLIAAMTNVHRFVQDPEVKRRLKESDGIGTEATRASIIETLLHPSRRFLERKGKTKIVSTAAGGSIIDVLPKEVTDPGLTAIWEAQLTKISQGEASDDQFLEILIKTLNRLVQRGKESGGVKIVGSIEPLPGHGETCPKCGKGQMITRAFAKGENKGKRFLACNAWKKDDPDSCRHAIWPEDKKPAVKAMPGDGGACPKCGQGRMVTRMSRTGKRFLSCNAWKKDDPNSCNHVVWDNSNDAPKMPGDGQPCSKCGKGVMRTRTSKAGKRFLSCDNWKKDDPNSCNNVVWDDSQPSSGGGKKPFRMGGKSSGSGSAPGTGSAPTGSPRRAALGRRRT